MNALSIPVAGTITIAFFVGLGIFVYPWLLRQRYGVWIVAVMTLLLGMLFIVFQGGGAESYSIILAAAWSLGPVLAGVIVWRIQRKAD